MNKRRLVVLGGGESGYGSAILGKTKGFDVFLSDNGEIADKYKEKLMEWEIPFEEGGHSEEKILSADEVVKSPGIPDNAPLIRKARALGIPVISEIEFAGRYTGSSKTICITGSNGKTTTTTLIYDILKDAGFDVGLGGNIGDSFAYMVATDPHKWYVLEISSFQLDGMYDFKADIAVLMNITPDHLDRYDHDMSRYIDSKMRIIRNQTHDDYFIYCNDDENICSRLPMTELPMTELPMRLLPFTRMGEDGFIPVEGHTHADERGAFIDEGDFIAIAGGRKFAMSIDAMKIKGIHNTYDAMAASLAALVAGVDENSMRRTLADFAGVEHRLEPAGYIDGVEYINDSKATNTDAVWYALESMTKPVVWIAGGTDKGNDYSTLTELVGMKVKALICMGVENKKLIESFGGIVPVIRDTHSLDDAMNAAMGEAAEGDVVLLSPACASFDLFRNYEDRGTQFKAWVKRHSGK
jgi:UDP-N-acetylmuramoylalanine--D-glutamate ligase